MARARALWTELAGVPVGFGTPAGVAVAPGSLLCPPGWAGIVRIGDAALVTAPDARTAGALGEAVRRLSYEELTDPVRLGKALSGTAPVLDVLGPAALFYLDRDTYPDGNTLPPAAAPAETSDDPASYAALLAAAGPDDAGESGLDEITSPAFLLRDRGHDGGSDGGRGGGGDVIAAAGYVTWPRSVAHLSVLVAPHRRGRGLAGTVASAAVSHALDDGLLPQWRARPYASRRVAARLGFRELGAQLSVRM
ncbi:GNAT family N-acetyltransferase [Streptomyces sp. NBC_01498]|uniref:GNAT family N-acetyltransferase n=1 Tax=Streptomyces sp. NBC_01498 TaxID=2975870 RepID=UPI002E7B3FC1|nr:GNAT family N-acetyltransferase [Streptomyces sp. NBC_01498]